MSTASTRPIRVSLRKARKLDKIAYEEMLELASVGAKVLQTRSVELAMKERVRVQVLSSFEDEAARQRPAEPGGGRGRDRGKGNRVRHRLFARRGEDHGAARAGPARASPPTIFGPLADANINVDMIVQNISADGTTDMTFTVGRTDLPRAQARWRRSAAEIGCSELLADPNVAKISVVGVGMRSHAGVANTMFRDAGRQGASTSR